MKTPIIIAGLAALVLFAPKSSSKSKKNSKKTIDGIGNKVICTQLQYNDKNKCIDFWIEGETDQIVLNEIKKQVEKLKDNSFEALCVNKEKDPINSEYIPNDNLQQIVKQTIHNLWPSVSIDSLPPTPKSPEWLKILWVKTNTIYAQKICGQGTI